MAARLFVNSKCLIKSVRFPISFVTTAIIPISSAFRFWMWSNLSNKRKITALYFCYFLYFPVRIRKIKKRIEPYIHKHTHIYTYTSNNNTSGRGNSNTITKRARINGRNRKTNGNNNAITNIFIIAFYN